MPAKKEMKKLSKDLVLAIEWAAAEYGYLEELKQELKEIDTVEVGDNVWQRAKIKAEDKKLRKTGMIVRYIGLAERRADKFEERARKKIEDFADQLSEHLGENFALIDLIKGFREVAKEMDVEHAHLAKFASLYGSKLEKYLKLPQAVMEAKQALVSGFMPPFNRQEKETSTLFQYLRQMEEQVEEVEKWARALESSLKKAKEYVEKYEGLTLNKTVIIKKGLKILHDGGWFKNESDPQTLFLAQKPIEDLRKLVWGVGGYYPPGAYTSNPLFGIGMHAVIDLLTAGKITWEQVVEDLPKMSDKVKLEVQRAGGNDDQAVLRMFTEIFPKVKDLINQENWKEWTKTIPDMALGKKTKGSMAELYPFVKLFGQEHMNIYSRLSKADYFKYFPDHEETCKLYEFMCLLVHEVEKSKIDFVYAIDRSGRILGFLLYQVLRNLGKLGKTKFYFIHATKERQVTFYSEQQKKEIYGKKVLVIDDFSAVGDTMIATLSKLRIAGPEKVIPYVFASFHYRPLYSHEDYHIVYDQEPSWFYKKDYSGVQKKPHGGVEVNKGAKEISRKVRKVLIKFAEIIAQYYY